MAAPETKILIASGQAEDVRLIESALQGLGYRHLTAVSEGGSARELLAAGMECMVVADWNLPGTGGLRLVRIAGNAWVNEENPCLLILPEDNVNERSIISDSGVRVAGILVRPLTEEQVAAKVETVVERQERSRWPGAMADRADLFESQGLDDDALREYRRGLDAGRKKLAGLHTEIGLALIRKGRYQDAIDHLEKAALNDPMLARAHAALGKACLEAGRPQEGAMRLARAARLDPANTALKRDLAESLLKSGQFPKAEKILEELAAGSPDDLFLLNRLGMALRKQGKFKRALDCYLKALRLNDRDENLYFNIGRCCFELGDKGKAVVALNQALNLNPQLASARRLLAQMAGAPEK